MKELVVLSGKGGTGKTVIVASFGALAQNKVMVDCDVDAADLHLLLQPEIVETNEFWSGKTAFIDRKFCTRCEICEQVCRFDAIKNLKVNPISCEGCGFCFHVCPDNAIRMKPNLAGHWFISDTRYGPLVHARLGIAEENSGKLVAVVRQTARAIAQERGFDYILSDGPPGIGCPVISASAGMDLALHVVEPTISGVHDLERIMGTTDHFGIPSLVLINKADLNLARSEEIAAFCAGRGVEVVGRIPYDDVVTEAMVQGRPVTDYTDGPVTEALKEMWSRVSDLIFPDGIDVVKGGQR